MRCFAREPAPASRLLPMGDTRRNPVLDRLNIRLNRPFAAAEIRSGRTLQAFSFAGQQAAENLLAKAHRALDDNDRTQARMYVDRAVRLPFDEHEQVAPVAQVVHMELFCAVTDALEQAPAEDSRWLEAALNVLGAADEAGACDLRDVLVAIDHDYSLSAGEHRRIRAAIALVSERAELRDLELTPSELGDHVMSVLEACRAFETLLNNAD
jgi:hypothetical protein